MGFNWAPETVFHCVVFNSTRTFCRVPSGLRFPKPTSKQSTTNWKSEFLFIQSNLHLPYLGAYAAVVNFVSSI